jgi:Ca-activated chloride channel family protein
VEGGRVTFHPIAPVWLLAPLAVTVIVLCALAARRPGRRAAWGRRALAVVLLTGIALRPGATTAEGTGVTTDLDVFVLVDRTASMVAEDYDGGAARMEGVKADLVAMARGLAGSRFALIGYDNNVVDLMPLTNDLNAFAVTVQILHPEMTTYSTGSSPRLPVEHLRRRLAAAAKQDPDRRRVVIIVSDGEATAGEPEETSFGPVAELIDGGVVLGYGTSRGGPMREWAGIEAEIRAPYLTDPATGELAVSRIDEPTLQAVADELDVGYVHRTDPGGIDGVLAHLGTGRGRQATSSELMVAQDRSWLLAWPLLALVLVEVAIAVAELARLARPRRGAAA